MISSGLKESVKLYGSIDEHLKVGSYSITLGQQNSSLFIRI